MKRLRASAGTGRSPRIKYPFLSCTNGQIGLAGGDENWENTRQIPQLGTWSESDGAYGPDQHQN